MYAHVVLAPHSKLGMCQTRCVNALWLQAISLPQQIIIIAVMTDVELLMGERAS